MKDNQLYQAIGDIDDVYIEEALEHTRQRMGPRTILMFSSLAAVLLLLVSLSSVLLGNDTIIFNDVKVVSGKEVPLDFTEFQVQSLSLEEANDYLNGFRVTSELKGLDLVNSSSDLVTDTQGIVYDRFVFTYRDQAGREVTLSTAMVEGSQKAIFRIGDASKLSVVKGLDVKLGREANGFTGETHYYAEFEREGVFITLKANGFDASSFLSIVTAVIDSH